MKLKDRIKAAGVPHTELTIISSNGEAPFVVGVRGLTTGESSDLAEMGEKKGGKEALAYSVRLHTYDPADNSPLFDTDKDVLDAPQSLVIPIAQAIARLSGGGERAAEEAQKNSSSAVS